VLMINKLDGIYWKNDDAVVVKGWLKQWLVLGCRWVGLLLLIGTWPYIIGSME